jgi:hypothetical protein
LPPSLSYSSPSSQTREAESQFKIHSWRIIISRKNDKQNESACTYLKSKVL